MSGLVDWTRVARALDEGRDAIAEEARARGDDDDVVDGMELRAGGVGCLSRREADREQQRVVVGPPRGLSVHSLAACLSQQ